MAVSTCAAILAGRAGSMGTANLPFAPDTRRSATPPHARVLAHGHPGAATAANGARPAVQERRACGPARGSSVRSVRRQQFHRQLIPRAPPTVRSGESVVTNPWSFDSRKMRANHGHGASVRALREGHAGLVTANLPGSAERTPPSDPSVRRSYSPTSASNVFEQPGLTNVRSTPAARPA